MNCTQENGNLIFDNGTELPYTLTDEIDPDNLLNEGLIIAGIINSKSWSSSVNEALFRKFRLIEERATDEQLVLLTEAKNSELQEPNRLERNIIESSKERSRCGE